MRCVKGVRIRSYSGPHFPGFRLNTERYEVFSIQSECRKIRTRITPNTNTFYAVMRFDYGIMRLWDLILLLLFVIFLPLLLLSRSSHFPIVLQNWCSLKLVKFHRKTPALESSFNKVEDLRPATLLKWDLSQLFGCEFCEIF